MDAHNNEYVAAATGMAEIYGSPHQGRTSLRDGKVITTWAVGDFVTFRTNAHGPIQGTVIEVLEENGEDSIYHIAAHIPGKGREHFAVPNRDVLIF